MENFKFSLVSFLLVLLLAGVGVLAYLALERGDESGLKQQVAQLQSQVASYEKQLAERDRTIAQLESDVSSVAVSSVQESQSQEPVVEPETIPGQSTDSDLLSHVRSLRDRNIVLEPGDRGGSVRIVQEFLNEYHGRSGGIDGDFGPTTRELVEDFQEEERIMVDGGVGSGTLGAMIEWLENN